jgi:hypothetical protein
MLYDIEGADSKTFKQPFVENYKMTITCLSHYKGLLAAVMNVKNMRDRLLVFYKYDGVSKMDPKVQPQSN